MAAEDAPASLSGSDRKFLDAAMDLAERGRFSAAPNPTVGALLVKDGQVLGRGYHVRPGSHHGEAAAIADAKARGQLDALRGATAYVSLEPCAFYGRTPPCCEALAQLGVTRVVGALTDPHPRVAGQGYQYLREAGVQVTALELPRARRLIEGYISRVVHERPFVRLKVATSLDGRTAMANGESQWITGPAARADVQYWRARSDAIITGRGTVAADDPAMTVRDDQYAVDGVLRQPLRVVLDSAAALYPEAKIFSPPEQALWVHGTAVKGPDSPVETLACGSGPVDLAALLGELARRGCNEVLVEAGPVLVGQFLNAGLWDEALVYLAPKWLGSTARPLALLPLDHMAQAIEATIDATTMVAGDLRISLRPATDT
ncbi:MAG: bifunctional diaminohydroxyphosphoribosylaminopyrimidine deaminase/5-amino-6-(5-phosphoribosylamino)uracil reductase RibD [Pseudomonadales bacterium]